jgi:death-on-curing protein
VEHLTVEDFLLIAETIGAGPVRDVGLLDGAAHRPQATAFGEEAHPTIHGRPRRYSRRSSYVVAGHLELAKLGQHLADWSVSR